MLVACAHVIESSRSKNHASSTFFLQLKIFVQCWHTSWHAKWSYIGIHLYTLRFKPRERLLRASQDHVDNLRRNCGQPVDNFGCSCG